jgi:spore coat protein U-like protein
MGRQALINLALAGTLVAVLEPAFAGQKNDAFLTRVIVAKQCIVVADDVDFGALAQVTGTETASGLLKIRCSKNTPFTVSLRATTSVTAINTNLVPLNALNTDRIRARITLSGTGATGTGLATSNTVTYSINGSLTANPLARPDTYRRNLTLYVNY